MKNLRMVLVTGAVCTALLCSCASTPQTDDSANEGMIANATPENSVLVYGYSSEPDITLYYVDETSDWKALVSTGNRKFSLPPAHKGARLVVKGSSWQKSTPTMTAYGSRQVWSQNVTLYEIENDEWNIDVPTDTPLYWMGFHSIMQENIMTMESIEALSNKPGTIAIGMPKNQAELDALLAKRELDSLKQLKKQYKGTAWEPVIDARIAELSD